MFVDLWTREGVDTSRRRARSGGADRRVLRHARAATGTSSRTCAPAARRAACGRIRCRDAMLRAARLVHASGISQAISASACDAVFAAFDVARGAGRDRHLRSQRAAEAVAARAGARDRAGVDGDVHVVPAEPGRRERAVRRLRADAVVDAMHRAGARGRRAEAGRRRAASCPTARAASASPRARVASVDATGAGDCFDGAFAARLMAGDDPFAAARYANVAAALATTGYGAVAPLPRAADVERVAATMMRRRRFARSVRGQGRAGRRRHVGHRRRHRRRVRRAWRRGHGDHRCMERELMRRAGVMRPGAKRRMPHVIGSAVAICEACDASPLGAKIFCATSPHRRPALQFDRAGELARRWRARPTVGDRIGPGCARSIRWNRDAFVATGVREHR